MSKGEFGEPWSQSPDTYREDEILDRKGQLIAEIEWIGATENVIARMIACVNACDGLDPATVPGMAEEIKQLTEHLQSVTNRIHDIAVEKGILLGQKANLEAENARLRRHIAELTSRPLQRLIDETRE